MKILIKFPSRGRPEKLCGTFSKYVEFADDPKNITFLVSLDDDDITATNAVKRFMTILHPDTKIVVGPPCGKIGAVNRDMDQAPDYDILLLASDDMVPIKKGYDTVIREKMAQHYPDGDGVLFFNDGFRRDLNTLCILGKKYYERFGYIYHPAYKSEWCDNEFMEVANKLGKQTYFDEVIIKHEHPAWTGASKDKTYLENDKYIGGDQQTFFRRKAEGFP